jgi:hypothetical protein
MNNKQELEESILITRKEADEEMIDRPSTIQVNTFRRIPRALLSVRTKNRTSIKVGESLQPWLRQWWDMLIFTDDDLSLQYCSHYCHYQTI